VIAPPDERKDRIEDAARLAAERDRTLREDREPTIAARLVQIGVLGWAIVAPILMGVVMGRWLDGAFKTGVFFTAPLIMLGAAAGLWTAWRWMRRQ
jgi:ATP synthase protein I